MSIKIIEEPDIYLTSAERDRLLDEYHRCMMFYAGPPISFENWVRANKNVKKETP